MTIEDNKPKGLASFNSQDIAARMMEGFGATEDTNEPFDPNAETESQEGAIEEAPAEESTEEQEVGAGENQPENDELELDGLDIDSDVIDIGAVNGKPRQIPKAEAMRYMRLGLMHTERGAELNQREAALKAQVEGLQEERELAANMRELERRLDTPDGLRDVINVLMHEGPAETVSMRRRVIAEITGSPNREARDEGDGDGVAPSSEFAKMKAEMATMRKTLDAFTKVESERQSEQRVRSLRERLESSLDRHKTFLPPQSEGREMVAEIALNTLRENPKMSFDAVVDAATTRMRAHIKKLQTAKLETSKKSKALGTVKTSDGAAGETPEPKLSYKDLAGPGLAERFARILSKGKLP